MLLRACVQALSAAKGMSLAQSGSKGGKDPVRELTAIEADREQANPMPQTEFGQAGVALNLAEARSDPMVSRRVHGLTHIYINMLICFYAYDNRYSRQDL